ncbi:hypothetical protein BJ508DRAFT_308687 [Ascobolus immersus RN42]|uniref:C2H2-type domain-containing protein n=1 Tax=Ascobolus immersus RN42 TaxID=1160509 RepID=A0A3N4IBJ5_ASCIM|nr:hypothetical protein BJ508DRAFT_308687 [Ascobolus immersus RN42]
MPKGASYPGKYSYVCHEDCNLTFGRLRDYAAHHNSGICNPPKYLLCEGCPQSKRIFRRIEHVDRHIHEMHEPEYDAKCSNCKEKFLCGAALDRHITFECLTRYSCETGTCERTVSSKNALRSHQVAKKHGTRIGCFGMGCRKTFASPSAMLGHLESGACECGTTRNCIRRIMMDGDKDGIITDREAIAKLLKVQDTAGVSIGFLSPFAHTNQSTTTLGSYYDVGSPSDGSQFELVDDIITTHHDHEGAVYLNTPSMSSATSSVIFVENPDYSDARSGDDWSSTHDSSSDSDDCRELESLSEEIPQRPMTPSSICSFGYLPSNRYVASSYFSDRPLLVCGSESDDESVASKQTKVNDNSKLYCSMCTEKERKKKGPFSNLEALERHAQSVYHEPEIYHCPKVSSAKKLTATESTVVVLRQSHELETQEDKAHAGQRGFKSLQALASHIESNACKCKNEMFKVVLDYVSGQLANMGMDEKIPCLRFSE